MRDFYREQPGWWAEKTSRSEGLDVMAWRPVEIPGGEIGGAEIYLRSVKLLLIEVKSTLTAFSSFSPAERRALYEIAQRYGGEARLFHWPKGISVERARVYEPHEWPKT